MTKDEALKLALEALEEAWYHVGTFQPTEKAIDLYDEARTAIKEALAQPEQPKVRTGNCLRVGICASEGHKIAPQRTWVGLTDEEIKALASWWPSYDQIPALMVLAKDIQNSLKEKNT